MGIDIKADPVTKIPVTLVGVDYEITPPKWALAMKMAVQAKTTGKDDPTAMYDTIMEWVSKAFGDAGRKAIEKRLDDPKDSLDLPHIMQLMEAVIEEQSAENPTS